MERNHHRTLQLLLERLHNSPPQLLRSDLQALYNYLQSSPIYLRVLQSLQVQVDAVRPFVPNVIALESDQKAGQFDFIDTYTKRAAFGWAALEHLLRPGVQTHSIVAAVGKRYRLDSGGNPTRADSEGIARFVQLFLEPVASYVEGSLERETLISSLLLRYKQRSEWFERDRLMEIAGNTETDGAKYDYTEERLKRDAYRFLFDNGVDFTIEAQNPGSKDKADVLSAKLPDDTRLIMEAKVFDGKNRGTQKTREGITQATSYASLWNEPEAYLLIFNIRKDARLKPKLEPQRGGFWMAQQHDKAVRIVILDLNVTISASKASQVKTIEF